MAADDSYTKLLLHCDGADSGVVFTDECGKTVTANGNVHTHQAEKKFGNASAYFDGNGDYLSLLTNDDFKFGTANFTIDMWVYPTSFATEIALADLLIVNGVGARNDCFILVTVVTTGKLRLFRQGAYTTATVGALTINQWNHVAVSNISGTFKFFIGGTLDATTTTIPSTTSGGLLIGKNSDASQGYMSGYLDEIRISKGIARWTGNFTPPTVEYRPRMNYLHARRDRMNTKGVSTQNILA